MKKNRLKYIATTMAMLLVFTLSGPELAAGQATLESDMNSTAAYIHKTVTNPQVGSVGGSWAVLGLARSGYQVPDAYYQEYYQTVENYVKENKGILHEKKYTEYSVAVLALTAIGKDPSMVGGYNLLTPLGDFDKTVWQGINGPIWALIALDSGDYAMPNNPDARTQATREMYIEHILSFQLEDGGFSLAGVGRADPDITGMALQALAKYQGRDGVKTAITKALDCLSKMQDDRGEFASWGASNSESLVQVIVALSELGISMDDARFVKNGQTLLDNLLSYRSVDGSFLHTSSGSGVNQMASEQGLYGMVAAHRAMTEKNSLYRMSDAISIGASSGDGLIKGQGLAAKDKAVKPVPVMSPGMTFGDIKGNSSIRAIESLTSRGIINGMSEGVFAPDKTMTRAEFAAIVVRGLGLTPKEASLYTDVSSSAWYAAYIGTASSHGIINGVGDGRFNPNGTITRQEAATMLARAAKLCGLETEMKDSEVRDMLAQFSDYIKSAEWARPSLAFCYKENILDQSALDIKPMASVLRQEIADMLFRLLDRANLI